MSDFGSTFSCFNDFDPSFRTISGVQVVAQSAYHRLRTFVVVGDGNGTTDPERTGADWGFDVVTLLGGGYGDADLIGFGATLQTYVLKDERIDTCDVTIAPTSRHPYAATVTVVGQTGAGPFSFVLGVGQTIADLLESSP